MKTDTGDVSLAGDRRVSRTRRLLPRASRGEVARQRWSVLDVDEVCRTAGPSYVGSGQEILDEWWSELPGRERNQALRLPAGVPLPEDLVVGLLLSGFSFPARAAGPSPVAQPEALRALLDRENARRRATGGPAPDRPADAHPARRFLELLTNPGRYARSPHPHGGLDHEGGRRR